MEENFEEIKEKSLEYKNAMETNNTKKTKEIMTEFTKFVRNFKKTHNEKKELFKILLTGVSISALGKIVSFLIPHFFQRLNEY